MLNGLNALEVTLMMITCVEVVLVQRYVGAVTFVMLLIIHTVSTLYNSAQSDQVTMAFYLYNSLNNAACLRKGIEALVFAFL